MFALLSSSTVASVLLTFLALSQAPGVSEAQVGCAPQTTGEQQYLRNFAEWLVESNDAGGIRSSVGLNATHADSVAVVSDSTTCNSVRTLVEAHLAQQSLPLPNTWNGVAVARLSTGVYLADPMDGGAGVRWWFVVRTGASTVHMFKTTGL